MALGACALAKGFEDYLGYLGLETEGVNLVNFGESCVDFREPSTSIRPSKRRQLTKQRSVVSSKNKTRLARQDNKEASKEASKLRALEH
jgi:hypothetical protein